MFLHVSKWLIQPLNHVLEAIARCYGVFNTVAFTESNHYRAWKRDLGGTPGAADMGSNLGAAQRQRDSIILGLPIDYFQRSSF